MMVAHRHSNVSLSNEMHHGISQVYVTRKDNLLIKPWPRVSTRNVPFA